MKIDINLNKKIFLRLNPKAIGNVIKILAGTDDFDITDFDFEEEELYNLLINQEEKRQNKENNRMKKAWETRRIKAEQTKKEIEDLKKQIQNQKEDLFKRNLPIGNNNRNFYNYNSQNTPSKNFDPVFNELILKHEKIIGQ